MHKHFILAAIVAIGLALPAYAQTTGAPAPTASAERPWEKAQAVLDATVADIQRGGIPTVQAHVADLEQALTDAPQALKAGGSATGPIYVLTDGMAESLVAMAAAGEILKKDPVNAGREIVAVNNPYPLAGLYLGSFYNEVGRPEEALRVLDAGLAASAVQGLAIGDTRPYLISERGVALSSLKRWPDALADYDEGLKLSGVEDRARARLYRGRGFSLTELGRLDEAEEAYRESLKLEPGNAIAQGELEYIARLRAGGEKVPGSITLPKTQ